MPYFTGSVANLTIIKEGIFIQRHTVPYEKPFLSDGSFYPISMITQIETKSNQNLK
jgi:hypothetical protein